MSIFHREIRSLRGSQARSTYGDLNAIIGEDEGGVRAGELGGRHGVCLGRLDERRESKGNGGDEEEEIGRREPG